MVPLAIATEVIYFFFEFQVRLRLMVETNFLSGLTPNRPTSRPGPVSPVTGAATVNRIVAAWV